MTSQVDAVFGALGDPTRRHLFETVAADGPITATELAAHLPVTRQAVAKHMGVLTQVGLVAANRQGREKRYRAVPAALDDARAWLDEVGQRWDARLAALRGQIEGRTDDRQA